MSEKWKPKLVQLSHQKSLKDGKAWIYVEVSQIKKDSKGNSTRIRKRYNAKEAVLPDE